MSGFSPPGYERQDWNIYTTEYYSFIKRNEILLLAEIWMDPETVT